MYSTAFYKTAVRDGFYGLERGGLFGKKDNVRKYWEDISIKLLMRTAIEKIKIHKDIVRIVDLGCGSGEGYELLTHVPVRNAIGTTGRDFVLSDDEIQYVGIDNSYAMIEQGLSNYQGAEHISFQLADLSCGFPFFDHDPYDIYFSSYASLSHLDYNSLHQLTGEIFNHIEGRGFVVYDLLGRYSMEWPVYWDCSANMMLDYTMAYLLPDDERDPATIEKFPCSFWSARELECLLRDCAATMHKNIKISMRDRSIFVGRHMDTGLFNGNRREYRYQVNRLFDRDFRGNSEALMIDLDYVRPFLYLLDDATRLQLEGYAQTWSSVLCFLDTMLHHNGNQMNAILSTDLGPLREDMDMMVWLYHNAYRFPVTDFWASVMGPQVACVLRNAELALPGGHGCGHGLFCVVEVTG